MPDYYDRYWSYVLTEGPMDDLVLKWPVIARHVPKTPGAVLVDFGCGDGAVMQGMAQVNPEAHLVGVDVSGVALEAAAKRLPAAEFHQVTDGGPIPLASATADFVLASDVLEHIYDTRNAAAEIGRVLRPGGSLLVTCPYHGTIKNLLLVLLAFEKHFDPTGAHIRFFTKRSLLSLLAGAGLQPTTCGYYGRRYPVPMSIFVAAVKA